MQCARKQRKDEGMMEEKILIVVLALPQCSKPRFLARKRKSWVCVCVSVVSNTHLDVVMEYEIWNSWRYCGRSSATPSQLHV